MTIAEETRRGIAQSLIIGGSRHAELRVLTASRLAVVDPQNTGQSRTEVLVGLLLGLPLRCARDFAVYGRARDPGAAAGTRDERGGT